MPLLPGTPGERISDLCNGRHISQKELAKRIGVSAPQLSRIVSGETKTINSDLLIAVAKEFKVSSDYILGLSEVSTGIIRGQHSQKLCYIRVGIL